MNNQVFNYTYKDENLQVKVEAQNGEYDWANNADLMDALQKVSQCAGNWKYFEFHVTGRRGDEV